MASDGLTNMVEEASIYEVITNNFENSDKVLINMANEAGGVDNITIVIIKNQVMPQKGMRLIMNLEGRLVGNRYEILEKIGNRWDGYCL